MPPTAIRTLLVSDFNADNLGNYLANADDPPPFEVKTGPFGQVHSALLDTSLWEGVDCAVVWTQPHRAIPAFKELAEGHPVPRAEIKRQTAELGDLLVRASERAGLLLVPSWVLSPAQRGLGTADFKGEQGLRAALSVMNAVIADKLDGLANAFVLDATRWHLLAGKGSFSSRMWFTAKVPFSAAVFAEAARDVRAAVRAQRGGPRKVAVLDLDDTLWGGVVGDVGVEGVRLGGHDHQGEAFVEFQRALKALTRRGILLTVASKNDEKVALEAMRSHPEMLIRPDDLAAHRINWRDKAENIVELAAELRLGLQSFVFLDNNPVERARVREALPEVLVPELPLDPTDYLAALHALDCFDAIAITREDAARVELYAAERLRAEELAKLGGADEWLASLGTEVAVEPLNPGNRVRTAQLLNKTNQMNLTTRRMTEKELESWAAEPGNRLWTFRVSDKFGDAGLTGIASVVIGASNEEAEIVDFVLSCRVMGRKVEETILSILADAAREAGKKTLVANYRPTEKNRPCLEFFTKSGMERQGDHRFTLGLADAYPIPNGIKVTQAPQATQATQATP
jgi:FkbH-like protein